VSVLRGTTTLTRVATARQPVVRHLVRWIAPRMARIPAIQRRIARTIAQLDIRYRGSPIVENHSVASPVHAGDRAPDAPVTVAATGAPTRLFQLFGGMLHSVVFVERADAPDAVRLVATTLADVVVGRYAPWVAVYLVGGLDSAPLSPAPAPAPVEPIVLVDHAGQVRARYGASVQVIRPDGYTGFRGRIDDGAQLLSYLDRLLPAAMPA
jgi:pentachlorophenol monooxygenase